VGVGDPIIRLENSKRSDSFRFSVGFAGGDFTTEAVISSRNLLRKAAISDARVTLIFVGPLPVRMK
jgi:hypothetical protein